MSQSASKTLLAALRHDHELLVTRLEKVKDLGVTSADGRRELLAIETILVAHLKREDAEFYPAKRAAAIGDAHLKQTLELFASDMDEISAAAVAFFDKHASGDAPGDFARDAGRFLATLKARIQREESILYKKYERLSL
jgi:hypothetical protein